MTTCGSVRSFILALCVTIAADVCAPSYAQFNIPLEDIKSGKSKADVIKSADWNITIQSTRTITSLSRQRFIGVTQKTVTPKNGLFVLVSIRAMPTEQDGSFVPFTPIRSKIFLVDKEQRKWPMGGWFEQLKGEYYDSWVTGEEHAKYSIQNYYFDVPSDTIHGMKLHISDEYKLIELKTRGVVEQQIEDSTVYKLLMLDQVHNFMRLGWQDRERQGWGLTATSETMKKIRSKYNFEHPKTGDDFELDLPRALEGSGAVTKDGEPQLSLKIPDRWHEIFHLRDCGRLPIVKYRSGTIFLNLKSMTASFSDKTRVMVESNEYVYSDREFVSCRTGKPKTSFLIPDIKPTLSGYQNKAVIDGDTPGEIWLECPDESGAKLVLAKGGFWAKSMNEETGYVEYLKTGVKTLFNPNGTILEAGLMELAPNTEILVAKGKGIPNMVPSCSSADWFVGNIDYEGSMYSFCGTVGLLGWTFESQRQNPLVFSLQKNSGLVYVSGKGKLISEGGKVEFLGERAH